MVPLLLSERKQVVGTVDGGRPTGLAKLVIAEGMKIVTAAAEEAAALVKEKEEEDKAKQKNGRTDGQNKPSPSSTGSWLPRQGAFLKLFLARF